MKKILLLATLFTCLALVFAAIFIWDDVFHPANEETGEAADIEKEMNTLYIDGKPYVRRPGVENYLIIGMDSFGKVTDAGKAQADFITVLSFDRLEKTCAIITVNRDTMLEVKVYDAFGDLMGVKYEQIALSHSTGSSYDGLSNHKKCENTSSAVSELLCGVNFDGYISMTMDAVVKMIDCIGGVSMLIEEDLTAVDEKLVKGDVVLLDGELAVKFIRARGALEDSSNIARMKRQEAFMYAFFSRVNEASTSEDELIGCFDSIEEHMVTDMDTQEIEWMASLLLSYEKLPAVTLPGEAKVGKKYMEFYVDKQGVFDIALKYFFDDYE